MEQLEQVLQAVLESVPADLLVAFLELVKQAGIEQVVQLMQQIMQTGEAGEDEASQIVAAFLQAVPQEVLEPFLQVLSQLSPEEIEQIQQMLGEAMQGGGEEQGMSPEEQGAKNLFGAGY